MPDVVCVRRTVPSCERREERLKGQPTELQTLGILGHQTVPPRWQTLSSRNQRSGMLCVFSRGRCRSGTELGFYRNTAEAVSAVSGLRGSRGGLGVEGALSPAGWHSLGSFHSSFVQFHFLIPGGVTGLRVQGHLLLL